MPVSNVLNFVKSTRTTLVNFFIHDVDLGLFIFIISKIPSDPQLTTRVQQNFHEKIEKFYLHPIFFSIHPIKNNYR